MCELIRLSLKQHNCFNVKITLLIVEPFYICLQVFEKILTQFFHNLYLEVFPDQCNLESRFTNPEFYIKNWIMTDRRQAKE